MKLKCPRCEKITMTYYEVSDGDANITFLQCPCGFSREEKVRNDARSR
jgi:phage FluMu protein Com